MITKNKFRYVLALFLLTIIFIIAANISVPVKAYNTDTIYDDGSFFTETEISKLEKELLKYESSAGIDIVIVTTTDLERKTENEYLEDYFDSLYDQGLIALDAALLLYGKDSEGRFYAIHGYGSAEYYVNNNRTQYIADDIIPLLRADKLYDAAIKFAEKVSDYMNLDPKSDPKTETYIPPKTETDYTQEKSILSNIWVQLLISACIGGITVAVMTARSGGKTTANSHTYMDSSHSGVVASRDNYIRTSVTKRKKPESNQNNGTGGHSHGGGVSKGGRSHSGGGGRI